jgi:uncharacterized caspase-like protein
MRSLALLSLLVILAGPASAAVPPDSLTARHQEPLKVQLAVNHPRLSYQEGDTLRVSVTASKDCFLRLIYSEADGRNMIIFPNYQNRDDRVKGEVRYSIPTMFQVTAPFGKETLHAFVSSEKFSSSEGVDRGDGMLTLKESLEEAVKKLRAGSIFGEYAEEKLEITTSPKQVPAPEAAAPPPRIEFSSPGPTEFAVESSDSALIEGQVAGEGLLAQVTVNGIPAAVDNVGDSLHFRLRVGLSPGENRFDVVVRAAGDQVASKTIVIKREQSRFAGQRWAVVVGISDYAHPDIPDLKYAHRDAQVFYDFLRSPNGGAFPDDHIRLLTNSNATLANVRSAIFDFLRQTRKEDLVMLYFSGHGLSRGEGYTYFIMHDTDPGRIEETAFNVEDIQTALRSSIHAERVVLFADACHSGAINEYMKRTRSTQVEQNLINRYLVEMAKAKPGMISFTSCAQNEVSSEAWLFWEHGIFTFVLVSGLGGKVTDSQGRVKSFESADADGDGIVTVGELTKYVTKYVPGYTKNQQNPQVSKSKFDPNMPLSVVRSP